MSKFKVGDRVRVTGYRTNLEGKIGTVIDFCGSEIGIEFDENIFGHSCKTFGTKGISGKNGHCAWMIENELEKVSEEKTPNESIVIYRKGNEVIALDKVTGDQAVAKCSLEDEFDFMIGATIAYSRLPRFIEAASKHIEGVKVEKFYNGKVVCVDNVNNQTAYTIGKVYKFENGVLINDNGNEIKPNLTPYKRFRSFEEFSNWTGSKFIEVVE